MAAIALLQCLLLVACGLAAPLPRQTGLHVSRPSEVEALPGWAGELPSRHYAGYHTVDKAAGRHLYYYLVTSERSPSLDPVVAWLNGGPGCSSFDGFVYEHGPFTFRKLPQSGSRHKVTLHRNPHAWSQAANILYVDSPAGVGLSYSRTPHDYHTNDTQTAADTHTFLRHFFKEFPEFRQNSFYISGKCHGAAAWLLQSCLPALPQMATDSLFTVRRGKLCGHLCPNTRAAHNAQQPAGTLPHQPAGALSLVVFVEMLH